MSIRAFEEEIGTSQGVLNKIINNNGDIKSSLLAKILEKFPHYNPLWLLTGTGDELIQQKPLIFEPDNTTLILLERIESLASENTRLKMKIEDLEQAKKYKNISATNIAAEP